MKSLFYLLVLLATAKYSQKDPVRAFHLAGKAQGTTYHITYYAQDSIVTTGNVDSIFQSLDSSLSIYKSYSLVSRFNASRSGLVLDAHLSNVVNHAFAAWRATNGIFDITVYPFTEAWGFGLKKINKLPTREQIQNLRQCCGSTRLKWSGKKLLKQTSCVRLDPNGIAQGYSVDVIGNYLKQKDIDNWLVEVGGELKVCGRKQPENLAMKVAIEVPGEDGMNVSLNRRVLELDSGAITTSGSYRRYFESNGTKVSHLIDARTGFPAKNELVSVSVYARDAVLADAMDNALMVMGLQNALAYVEKRKDIDAYFIYRRSDGSIADTASTRFYRLFRKSID